MLILRLKAGNKIKVLNTRTGEKFEILLMKIKGHSKPVTVELAFIDDERLFFIHSEKEKIEE